MVWPSSCAWDNVGVILEVCLREVCGWAEVRVPWFKISLHGHKNVWRSIRQSAYEKDHRGSQHPTRCTASYTGLLGNLSSIADDLGQNRPGRRSATAGSEGWRIGDVVAKSLLSRGIQGLALWVEALPRPPSTTSCSAKIPVCYEFSLRLSAL